MEENVPSREQLIREIHELRSRVHHFEQVHRECEQVKEELRGRGEVLMAIVQASPLAIVAMDAAGAVTLWNPSAERIFGWTEEEILGKPLPYVTEEMRHEHVGLRKRVLSGEAFAGVEVHRCRKDGSFIDISVSTAPLRDAMGNIIGIMSLNEDITERKRLADAHRMEKHFSESAINSLPGLYYLFDESGRMSRWNRDLEIQSGYSSEEIGSMTALQFVSRESLEAAAGAIKVVFERGEAQVEATFLAKDGKEIPCLFTGKRVQLGDTYFLCGMAIDMSQQIASREALIRSEDLLKKTQEIAHIGSWERDLVAHRLTWSDEVYRMFGVLPEEFALSVESFFEAVHPDDREAVNTAYSESLFQGRDTYEIEHRIIRGDNGEVRIVLEKCEHVRDAAGSIVRSVGMVQDITELKRTQQALLESRALLQSIFDSTEDFIWSVDPVEFGLLSWNESFRRYFSTERGIELRAGMTPAELVPPEYIPVWHGFYSQAFLEGPYAKEYEVSTGSRTLLLTISPMKRNEETFGISVFGKDISKRKRAAEALRESEERFSVFMSHLPASAFIKDSDGRLMFANRYVRELFGIDDYFGKTTPEVIAGELAVQMTEDDRRALADGIINVQETVRDTHGRERIFKVVKFPIHTAGKSVLLGGIALDITDFKQVEAALRESKERMSQALRAANAGAWEWNMSSNKAIWSDENYLVLGLEPGSVESCYENWLSAVHPDDRAEADRLVSEAVQKRSDLDISFRVVWPDGSVHWLNDRGKLAYDESGKLLGMYGIQIDISDKKLAELALEESERGYREIFNGTKDAIIIHDPESGSILDVNQGMLDMFGCSKEEAVALTIDDLSLGSAPYDQHQAFEHLRKAFSVGPQTFEWVSRRKNGELFWSEVVLKSADIGGTDRVLAVVRDIDARKRAEKALAEKEEYYRSLFENALDNVTLLSSDGTILFESPSVERMIGYRPEELVGLDAFSTLHPEDVEHSREIFERVVRRPGAVVTAEFRCRHRDGSFRILESIGKNLLHNPVVRAIVVNQRDVTERRLAEQQLRVSLEEKETLLREIHHRVKNNLQVVSSLLDLQAGTVSNPETVAAFKDSRQRVKAMAMIHERLYGKGHSTTIVLSDYVKDLVRDVVQAHCAEGSISVDVDISAILLSVNAAIPCGLIINELITNSLKHAFVNGEKGHVRVCARSTEENKLTLTVEDDGRGLPEHVDIKTARSLGLTIVKALAKQLNATIEIERTAGTRVRVVFQDKPQVR